MLLVFFCQAEDGIRYLVRSRGLGDVYKRQAPKPTSWTSSCTLTWPRSIRPVATVPRPVIENTSCLLYTSDAADERSSVDLGGRRIIKTKNQTQRRCRDNIPIISLHSVHATTTTPKSVEQ